MKKKKFSLNSNTQKLLKKGEKTAIPKNIQPMLATLVTAPVAGDAWLYEMKWDGYRAISYLQNDVVNICSRNNKSFNQKFYPIHEALQQWGIHAVVDGEIVVVNEEGVPDFSTLQLWRSEADGQILYYLFDILWLEGVSIMNLPLEERKAILKAILPTHLPIIKMSELIKDNGEKAFEHAKQLQLEGVMAKKSGSIYTIGQRNKNWLKIKTEKRQELIVGGYTLNEGTNKLFSALLLGIMEKGKFHFVTPVGTGFNKKMQEEILKKLEPFETNICPFAEIPEYNKPSRFPS